MRWYPAAGFLIIVLAGCLTTRAADDCDRVLETYGQEGRDYEVSAAFETTVGSVRAFGPRQVSPPRWPEARDQDYASLCYIDGPMGKAPPPAAPRHDPYDRAVVGIWNGDAQVIAMGYQTSLPVTPP